jgi:Holliday junction resolvase RusA-like endonuclease
MFLNIDLQVKPEPQQRVRVYKRIAIDPSKEYKNFLKLQLISHYNGEPIKEPVALKLTFRMPIPKSTSKKRRKAMLEGKYPHVKRPDIDNLAKALLDALNKTIIEDDSQIYSLFAEKIYSDKPGIHLHLNTNL